MTSMWDPLILKMPIDTIPVSIWDAYVDISRIIHLRPFKLLKYLIKYSFKHCNLTSV
jgi:hypothetical protein